MRRATFVLCSLSLVLLTGVPSFADSLNVRRLGFYDTPGLRMVWRWREIARTWRIDAAAFRW